MAQHDSSSELRVGPGIPRQGLGNPTGPIPAGDSSMKGAQESSHRRRSKGLGWERCHLPQPHSSTERRTRQMNEGKAPSTPMCHLCRCPRKGVSQQDSGKSSVGSLRTLLHSLPQPGLQARHSPLPHHHQLRRLSPARQSATPAPYGINLQRAHPIPVSSLWFLGSQTLS